MKKFFLAFVLCLATTAVLFASKSISENINRSEIAANDYVLAYVVETESNGQLAYFQQEWCAQRYIRNFGGEIIDTEYVPSQNALICIE